MKAPNGPQVMRVDLLFAAVEARRSSAQLTQTAVMEACGLSRSRYNDLRMGRSISAEVLMRIMMWLGAADIRAFMEPAAARCGGDWGIYAHEAAARGTT